MKKFLVFIFIPVMIIVLAGLFFLKQFNLKKQEIEFEKYEAIEVLNQNCHTDMDCEIPFDYLVKSNCPYEIKCYKRKCVVVCPDIFFIRKNKRK